MESINSFEKGMNLDVNPLQQPKGTYREAFNTRIINDTASTSYSLNNILGNELNLTIPNTPTIQQLTIIGNDAAEQLEIAGETGSAFDTTGMTPEDLYNYIKNDAAYTLLNVDYNIYYSGTQLLIVPINFASITIVLTGTGLANDSNFIPANSDVEVIGSCILRDDIYLFTTNCGKKNPGGHDLNNSIIDASSLGQIWKYNYDKITNIGSISLIYIGYLDFSTYWCIAPTATIGRYENSSIQRIYWTDFYNKLRSLNVADPQVLATEVSSIDVIPAVDFDIPLLTNIRSAPSSSLIPIGCYQLAYRLKNNGGATTTYSTPSNNIFVVTGGNGGAEENQIGGNLWIQYHGDIKGTTTTKQFTWTINNLDLKFDRIEAVILFREDVNDIPTITKVYDAPITSESIDITINGDIINSTDSTPITLQEFNLLNNTFTHCKTISTKDNRLFVANVRSQIAELDFDARAYRFKALNTFDLIENGSVNTYTAPADYANIVDNSDAIATLNVEASDPGNYNAIAKYKANGVTLGGEGPNISYEFISVAVAADKTVEPVNPQPLPIVSTNPDYVTSILDLGVYSSNKDGSDVLQEYPIAFPNPINNGMKFPQMNSIYWGYQNNEIYRMGIQFYDKSKNPYFVKWIGDIKFPDYLDICPATNNLYEDGSQTGILNYRKSFTTVAGTYGANEAYVCQLGLKLNITIPDELTDKISGYSIVRVKRDDINKTIIAEGIIPSGTVTADAGVNMYLPIGDMGYNTVAYDMSKLIFLTPNILNASLETPNIGMKLRSTTYLDASNVTQDVAIDAVGSSGANCKLLKMFTQDTLNTLGVAPVDVNIDLTALLRLNEVLTLGGSTYHNSPFPAVTTNGNPAYVIVTNSALDGTLITGTQKYFVHIYNGLISQYGGNTFNDRSNNEYILCSHFRSIKTKVVDYIDSSFIFGGDVTNDIMDEERISVIWTGFPGQHNTTTFFYPSSSPVNRRLRHGLTPNGNLNDNSTINNDRTDYFYNDVYSCENDYLKFYPKPNPFLNNEEFDNRFYASEIKINGELSDSWSSFKANNYWDVEGDKGPINAITTLKDKMYFWQDRAFGIMSINPRVMVTDTANGTDLQLGTGLVLQRHDYLSTEVGCQHQWGITKSSYKLFWLDVNNKKFFAFGGEEGLTPESDIKGLFSWFNDKLKYNINNVDKPVYEDLSLGVNGIRCTYDFKYNQAIFTLSDGKNVDTEQSLTTYYTFTFDERLNCFNSFHTYFPKVYFTDGYKIFSTDKNWLSNIHMHDTGQYCKFYDIIYESTIKLVINDNFQYTKVFDNLMWDSEATSFNTTYNASTNFNDDTWDTIRIYNDYQNTDTQALTVNSNIKRKERTWQLQIPRNRVLYTGSNSPNIFNPAELSTPNNKSFGERIRDKYLVLDLTYANTNNRLLSTNNIRSVYRQSPR